LPSLFRDAVTENGPVDPGYLGLYVAAVMTLGSIPVALILVGIRMGMLADHPLDLVGIAAIIGAAGTAFGVAATGVGLFRKGDKPNPNTTTSIAQQSTTTTVAPPMELSK
jgi:hypothetical protein